MHIDQNQMVQEQLLPRGIEDKRVIRVMSDIKRESFVPDELKCMAYNDTALPIGYEQTISQPFIVAFMTQSAKLTPESKVLEIGTGSGYQTAIISKLSKVVYSIEVVKELGEEAKDKLEKMGYKNINIKIGNGYYGWSAASPFDSIIVTAAPKEIPDELVNQLKEGGRLIIPIGTFSQELMLVVKTKKGVTKKRLMPVRFVPMVN